MKLRYPAALILLAIGLGLAWVLTPTGLAAPKPEDEAIRKLAEAKLKAAKAAYEAFVAEEQPGTTLQRYDWSRCWLDAELEVAMDKKARVSALEGHFQRMSELYENAKAEMDRIPPPGVRRKKDIYAAYYRAEAELWLAKEKAR